MKVAAWLLVLAAFLPLADAAELPHYRPAQAVAGEIRIWGSPDDAALIKAWDDGFRKFHRGARLATMLHGYESALASIYTGAADIAFVARELRKPVDTMAFQWVKLYAPSTIEVANAGVRSTRPASNLAVFVHPDNPIAGLTVAQLDGIFGAEHKRAGRDLRTWGELGLAGEWRDRPIRALAPQVTTIAALFFRQAVLNGSFKWNEDMREFPTEAEALAEVARDPSAITYACNGVATAAVKAVPLAAADDAKPVALTAQTAADRSYPLSRVVIVAFDRAPEKHLDPKVHEFLRYVLSNEGQEAIARDGAYVPLTPHDARVQRKKLE